jgi:hypothetical protein
MIHQFLTAGRLVFFSAMGRLLQVYKDRLTRDVRFKETGLMA